MGLSDAIKAGVSAAFAAIGDIKQTVSYTHDPAGSYDPTTGQVASGGTVYWVQGVSYEYDSHEVNNVSIYSTDRKFIIEAASITFTPKIHDLITIDGAAWRVEDIYKDPIVAIWILQIRRP